MVKSALLRISTHLQNTTYITFVTDTTDQIFEPQLDFCASCNCCAFFKIFMSYMIDLKSIKHLKGLPFHSVC